MRCCAPGRKGDPTCVHAHTVLRCWVRWSCIGSKTTIKSMSLSWAGYTKALVPGTGMGIDAQPKAQTLGMCRGFIFIFLDAGIYHIFSSQSPSQTSLKQSWVRNHLKVAKDNPGTFICQIVGKLGAICGKRIKKEQTGSKKSLHSHLSPIHSLMDPNIIKKTKGNQMDLGKWTRSGVL
ncbi:hypothetical protein VP01_2626g3 [Puccinia sorghi]|uniref:Uncharacterized protein n=1 Tax=Puccinia sorghi TaxID=27349 RepID=A0A0L6V4D0_9BASI|nr:hypothetical protein VP01_2626g3 [Puccinia sorghi]